ncbi:MAG TPA: hypothetical protein VFG76_04470, partial [Candidatus Polarisedimenticolia bacterium]|nr:hypothetical protein [Candidatus Polarisedimenticolia bacterium]
MRPIACLCAVLVLLAATPPRADDDFMSGHERMLAILKHIADNLPENHYAFPQKKVPLLKEQLEQQERTVPAGDRRAHTLESCRILYELGQAQVHLGETQAGIDSLLKAQKLLDG